MAEPRTIRERLMETLFGRSDGATAQTRAAIAAEERHQLTGERAPAPVQPQARTAPANTGLSTRPLTAREAAASGDPRLLEALRRRQQVLTQQPAQAPSGFGVGSTEQDAAERARLGLPAAQPGSKVRIDTRPKPAAPYVPPPVTDPAMKFLQKEGIRR